jgi:hypothetical protein
LVLSLSSVRRFDNWNFTWFSLKQSRGDEWGHHFNLPLACTEIEHCFTYSVDIEVL